MKFTKKAIILALVLFASFSILVLAQETISFTNAKALSKEQNKPLLMEFVRSD